MDGAAADELTVAAVTTAAAASDGSGKVNSQSGQREAQAGEAPAENGGDLPAAQPREPPSDAASTGDRGESHGVKLQISRIVKGSLLLYSGH